MNESTIDSISQEDFETTLQAHIRWASDWDGSLPAAVFFGVWTDLLQLRKQPVELKVRVVAGRLEIAAPPESPLKVVDNHIYLDNGLELIINLG